MQPEGILAQRRRARDRRYQKLRQPLTQSGNDRLVQYGNPLIRGEQAYVSGHSGRAILIEQHAAADVQADSGASGQSELTGSAVAAQRRS